MTGPNNRSTSKRSLLARVLLVVATIVGLTVVVSAAAHAGPFWQEYHKDSDHWHCDRKEIVPPPKQVYMEACVVINRTYTQPVMIIGNLSGDPIEIEAPIMVEVGYPDGFTVSSGHCYVSTLNTGLSRACFGRTVQLPCSNEVATVQTAYIDRAESVVQGKKYRMCR